MGLQTPVVPERCFKPSLQTLGGTACLGSVEVPGTGGVPVWTSWPLWWGCGGSRPGLAVGLDTLGLLHWP